MHRYESHGHQGGALHNAFAVATSQRGASNQHDSARVHGSRDLPRRSLAYLHMKLLVADGNRSRTHLSLDKDAPETRAVHATGAGRVVIIPQVGALEPGTSGAPPEIATRIAAFAKAISVPLPLGRAARATSRARHGVLFLLAEPKIKPSRTAGRGTIAAARRAFDRHTPSEGDLWEPRFRRPYRRRLAGLSCWLWL